MRLLASLSEERRHRDVCVDFDNTIIDNDPDSDTFLQPLPGARDALQTLRDEGYHVIVWSARSSPVWTGREGKILQMQAILRAHALPHDEVDMGDKGKRPCLLYIDDNAVHFTSWEENLPEVLRRLKEREAA